ncbi:hypothetical protein [Magnetofaba australis]|uniref:Uncharacterized protein n=1 Tax=Magnetofaba australis IT-1 TaxID=1434232 RepID=A0A1Y2JYJ8_9PROT|nr:hypothetical protein [Magnetofaba australis]OSM00010.1 hypothetical protein MAIT1_00409 [Magnetofaba australis IT-1]
MKILVSVRSQKATYNFYLSKNSVITVLFVLLCGVLGCFFSTAIYLYMIGDGFPLQLCQLVYVNEAESFYLPYVKEAPFLQIPFGAEAACYIDSASNDTVLFMQVMFLLFAGLAYTLICCYPALRRGMQSRMHDDLHENAHENI